MARIPIPCPMTGGVNRFLAPHDIRDDELVSCKNLYPAFPGHLTTRPSSAILGYLTNTPGDGYPVGLQFLPVNAPARFVVFTRSFDKSGVINPTYMLAFPDMAGSLLGELASASFGVATPYSPALIAYLGKVYAFGGYGSSSVGKILQLTGGGGVEIVDFTFSTDGN